MSSLADQIAASFSVEGGGSGATYMARTLDQRAVHTLAPSTAAPTTTSYPPTVLPDVPIYQGSWFAPAVALTVIGIAGVLILTWPKGKAP